MRLSAQEEWSMPLSDLRILLLVAAGKLGGARAVARLMRVKWDREDAEALVEYVEQLRRGRQA